MCLDSLQNQTYGNWVAFVADDCSVDASLAVVRAHSDHRVMVERRTDNVGPVANTNLLLRNVSTEYFAILHQDDWWEPEFLGTLKRILDSTPTALIATCTTRVVGDQGSREVGLADLWPGEDVVPSREALALVLQPNRMFMASVLARSRLLHLVPPLETSVPLVYDWLLWIRAATVGDFRVSRRILANYRAHPESISSHATDRNLWVDDYIRLEQLVEEDWSARGEPYVGARQQLRSTIWAMLLGQALRLARRRQRTEAGRSLRAARSLAPSRASATINVGAIIAAAVLPDPILSGIARMLDPLTRVVVERAGKVHG
jgi:glycosyltransferase involved in cell wall biosynthesis